MDILNLCFPILFSIIVLLTLDSVGFLLRKYDLLKHNSRIFEPFILTHLLSQESQIKFFGGYYSDSKYYPVYEERTAFQEEETSFWKRFRVKKEKEIHYRELMKVLLGLDEESVEKLLELYKAQFGAGAARYARKTYRKWENGEVRPVKQTFERFLVHLPKVMDYDLKCEVLRHLMEEYCAKDKYNLTVYSDDWEKTLEPLVRKIIDKPFNAALPVQIERRLKWLAEDEMQIAESILKRSQVEEGKIAVSMLREEFANIHNLLENSKGKTRITHELKFPYGTINLEIKKR